MDFPQAGSCLSARRSQSTHETNFGTSGNVPDIPDLIRSTTKLRRDLIGLVRRFPEDHLDVAAISRQYAKWTPEYEDRHTMS